MRRFIRWIWLAALTVLVLPILHEFALQHHFYENPTVSTLLGYVRGIPHFEYVLAFVGGLTLGTWIEAILTGSEGRQSEKYAALGDNAIRVREAIQMELEKVDRQRDHASASLLAEVNSLMLDLRKAGIPVPFAPKGTDVEKWLEMASVTVSQNEGDSFASNVRFGSLADIVQRTRYVGFTPDSGHSPTRFPCPLCANTRH